MQAVGFKRFPVWSLVGGYVVARRRSSACLLTAHALVALGAMAVAAGTFDWLASNDHARTGTTKSLIESLGQAAGSDPRGERATRVGGRTAPDRLPLPTEDVPAIRRGSLPRTRKSQAQLVICSPCAEPLELTAPAASADATRPPLLPWTTAAAASTALLAILYRWRPFCLYLPILSQSKKTCTTMIRRTMVQFRLDEVNHDQAVIARAVIPFYLFHYRPGQ